MSGHRRRIRGLRENRLPLFGVSEPLGPKIIRNVTIAEAQRLIRQGRAVVIAEDHVTYGFQMLRDDAPKRGFEAGGSAPSCTAFSRTELDRIIGVHGESRTALLSEEQRRMRHSSMQLPEYDRIEETHEKLRVYAGTH